MAKSLTGKAALVTGGSRGIGAAIAKRLAAEGAKVAITYVSNKDKADAVVKEIQAQGGEAVAILADSGDRKAVAAAVTKTVQALGRLDILVNNAGVAVLGSEGTPEEIQAALDRQFAVNVHGPAAAVDAAAAHMNDNGRIITIGSVMGDRAMFKGASGYSATKAAVAGYSRGWAHDFGARGITVNTVQPGPIDTDMNPADTEFANVMKGMTALGRYGRPEEIAAAVAFLASPEASYITGTTLTVDGGINA
ncbi:MAG TPA: SDR family oxidoreductase [Patescibacteria group bacterium]|nr:SDR family oxidoreductase [Patescibacteria group bacterium]